MIVVTGGAGFIGSNLVKSLLKNSYRVAVCDHFGADDKWRHLLGQHIEEYIPADRLEQFLESRSDVEAVFHMGAISSTTEMDVGRLLANNYEFSKDVWRVCARKGIRLVYASSASTYGSGAHGFTDDASMEYLGELEPLNPYGWSKHIFDQWVMSRVQQEEKSTAKGTVPPQWAGLKFFNVYGPGEDHKGAQASVVWHFMPQIAETGHVKLFKSHNPDCKDGEQRRDFVWVGDCVAVMMWLLQNPKVNGLFNVGTGEARTFNDLARSLFNAMEQPAKIDYMPMPENIREHYQYFTQADMGKLKAAGYNKPFVQIEEGVAKYVKSWQG